MTKTYEFAGHGTTLFAAGDEADGFYVHQITTPHEEEEDWESIAFIPHHPGNPDMIPLVHCLAAAFDTLTALKVLVEQMESTSAWEDACNGQDAYLVKAMTDARAAIAKAEAH